MIRNAKIVGKLITVTRNGYQGQSYEEQETHFFCETCNHQFPAWLKGDKLMLARLEHRLDHLEGNIPEKFMVSGPFVLKADPLK